MPKSIFYFSLLLSIAILGAGCSSKMPELSFKNYVQDKQRVDREVSGSVGNWANAPDAEEPFSKETRRMYILEVTQDVELTPQQKVVMEEDFEPAPSNYKEPISRPRNSRPMNMPQEVSIPSFDDIDIDEDVVPGNVSSGSGRFTEYTIQKDDTLQKIAKKFYDSYSKWPRIFEANKNTIKSPDSIKPGMVIRVPLE